MHDFHPLLQFCLAHLIRDVKFLVEHPNKKNQTYGQLLLTDLRRLFGVIHRRDEYASAEHFDCALEHARSQLVWDATRRSPLSREAFNLAQRFREHADSYFPFHDGTQRRTYQQSGRNRPSVLSRSIAASPRAHAAKMVAAGASASGR